MKISNSKVNNLSMLIQFEHFLFCCSVPKKDEIFVAKFVDSASANSFEENLYIVFFLVFLPISCSQNLSNLKSDAKRTYDEFNQNLFDTKKKHTLPKSLSFSLVIKIIIKSFLYESIACCLSYTCFKNFVT